MERPATEYYDPAAAGRPAPQLTKAQLSAMSPDDVVRADDLGQFEVLKSQHRDPIAAEQRGERWATPAEAQAQLAAERAAVTRMKHDQLIEAKKNGLDV
ncbi:MAG: hypothetical protein R2703_16670 [Micropruina glycogenica]